MVVLCRNPQAPSVAALGTLTGGGGGGGGVLQAQYS